MDALELLKTWPGWSNAGAETVLASPAWRLPVRMGETVGRLTLGTDSLTDTIDLDVTLDGEPHVLSLADSPLYPDLHLLWNVRAGLPSEVLLALLERECGPLFSMLEGATRRLFGVKGLASAPSPAARRMNLDLPAGTLSFALDLPPEVLTMWGRLENLDVGHSVIRAQTRPARVDYCSLMLTEGERSAMASGDHLLVPETFANTQAWMVDDPADEAVHLCSAEFRDISFAEFAEDSLPPIPESSEYSLMLKGQELRKCRLSHLGCARTVLIIS